MNAKYTLFFSLFLWMMLFFCVSIAHSQEIHKFKYALTPDSYERLGKATERPVYFDGVLIGLQNMNDREPEMLIWLYRPYAVLALNDNVWHLTEQNTLELAVLGKVPYEGYALRRRPIRITQVSGDNLLATVAKPYFEKDYRNRMQRQEQFSKTLVQAFAKGNHAALAEAIDPEQPYISVITNKARAADSLQITKAIHKKELVDFLKTLQQEGFEPFASRLLTCHEDLAAFNLPDLPENKAAIIKNVYFKEKDGRLYLSRIEMRTFTPVQ